MDLTEDEDLDTPGVISPAGTQYGHTRSDVALACDDMEDTQEVAVGQINHSSEGALCQLAEKGGLTLKGQICMGGEMEITNNHYQDNRTVNKQVYHHHGDAHQHTHSHFIKEGDVIHHHGDLHHSHHVHYNDDNQAGYAQIKDQSELAMLRDQEVFVETWAYRAALQRVAATGLLLVSGPSGCGKTCVAHALLRRYRASGYTPLVLHRFEEWRAHVGGDRQQVILLEDIFGKDQFQSSSFLDWVHTFPTIQQLATSGKSVVIITANNFVLDTIHAEHGSCCLLSHTFNMASSDAYLSDDEKKCILETHLKRAKKTVSEEVFEKAIQSKNNAVLFPAQCKLFAESPLDEREALRVLVAGTGDAFGSCGSGPKVFFKISPDIIKKSLLKPPQKVGLWNYSFTNSRGDIRKSFDEDNWITENIKRIQISAGTNTNIRLSEHTKDTPSTFHDSDGEEPRANIGACDVISRFEAACRTGDNQLMLEMIESEDDILTSNKDGFTALHVAALADQPNIVEELLSRKCSVNATDKQGWTPLHVACYSGHTEIVKHLINHGAKLELSTHYGMRALHIACKYGHLEIIQLLLQYDADTEARPNVGFKAYPLHVAAYYGQVNVVKMLIQFKAQTNVTDRGGWHPLHYACQEGHLAVVEVLLSVGADRPAHTSLTHQLHISCQNGHIHLVKTLLQCGLCTHDLEGKTAVCRSCYLSNKLALENLSHHQIYPCTPGYGNVTALFLAAQNGHYETVNALLKSGACTEVRLEGWTPLLIASYKGHHRIVELLLQYKTDVNDSIDNLLLTSLHLASANGRKETVEVLLQYGAVPDARDNHGMSPLHRACIDGQSNVLPSLLSRVKDLYNDEESAGELLSLASTNDSVDIISTLQGWFPNIFEITQESVALHKACRYGKLEIVKLFLENGFPVNNQSSKSEYKGQTPIHVASSYGHPLIVDTLISHGASVDEKTSDGNTALHIACKENYIDVVRVLLEKGSADTEITNKWGETSLLVAADKGCAEIVKLLVAYHANVNAQNSSGETPLICGRLEGSVVDTLLENKADARILSNDGETILHKICTYGVERILQVLLRHRVDLETKDKNGETALLMACRAKKNRNSVVKLLLENEANIEAADEQGVTPVQRACILGDTDLLHELIQHGSRVNSHNKNGETPLHQACMHEHGQLIEVLQQAGAVLIQPDHDGNTALHKACAHLQPDTVKQLLHHGANISVKNKDGLTAMNIVQSVNTSEAGISKEERRIRYEKRTEIMFAFMQFNQRFSDTDSQLVARGTADERCENVCDTSTASCSGMSQQRHLENDVHSKALGRVTETEQESKQFLVENKISGLHEDSSKLVDAKVEDNSMLKRTLQTVHERDQMKRDNAMAVVNIPTLETDTRKGTDVDETSTFTNDDHTFPDEQNGSSCENLTRTDSVPQARKNVVNEGNLCGFECNSVSSEPSTRPEEPPSLHQACLQGRTDLVLHHLLTSSDVDAIGESGRGALHYACTAGQHDIAALLLKHGADPRIQDTSGRTCLHAAALHGDLSTVDLLLMQGVDVNVADKEGQTALHLAASQGHGLVTTLLFHHGAEINMADFLGNTPLMLACAGSHVDACVVLLNCGADSEGRNKQGEGVCDVVKSRNFHVLEKVIARHSALPSRRPCLKRLRVYRESWWYGSSLFYVVMVVSAFLAFATAVCLTWL